MTNHNLFYDKESLTVIVFGKENKKNQDIEKEILGFLLSVQGFCGSASNRCIGS